MVLKCETQCCVKILLNSISRRHLSRHSCMPFYYYSFRFSGGRNTNGCGIYIYPQIWLAMPIIYNYLSSKLYIYSFIKKKKIHLYISIQILSSINHIHSAKFWSTAHNQIIGWAMGSKWVLDRCSNKLIIICLNNIQVRMYVIDWRSRLSYSKKKKKGYY